MPHRDVTKQRSINWKVLSSICTRFLKHIVPGRYRYAKMLVVVKSMVVLTICNIALGHEIGFTKMPSIKELNKINKHASPHSASPTLPITKNMPLHRGKGLMFDTQRPNRNSGNDIKDNEVIFHVLKQGCNKRN